jgi:hypothetical protein
MRLNCSYRQMVTACFCNPSAAVADSKTAANDERMDAFFFYVV